jgi:hypothetical protein
MRADGHDEADSHFSNFRKAPKNVKGKGKGKGTGKDKGKVRPITGHEGPEVD